MANMINCPYCGKLANPGLDSCPHCGGRLSRKAGADRKGADKRQTCPNCQALVQEGDIICVACGTNLLTGQKIVDEEKEASAPRRRVMPLLVAGAVVLVVAVIAGAVAYRITRDPVRQARELRRQGQLSAAIDLLRDHVADRTRDREAFLVLGQFLLESGQHQRSAEAFEEAYSLDPRDTAAAMWGVRALAPVDTPDAHRRQEALLEQVVASNPQDSEAWLLLALVRGARGDTTGQVAALERVLELRPTDLRARTLAGVSYALQGDLEQADNQLRTAANIDPDSPAVQGALGFVAALRNDQAVAEANLVHAADAPDPVREDARVRLGMLHLARGNYPEAVRRLRQAVTEGAATPEARYYYGVALRAAGATDDALVQFGVLQTGTGPFAGRAALQNAMTLLGREVPSSQDMSEARRALDLARRELGSNASIETLQGRIHLIDGNDSAAQDAFRRAISLNPDYAPARLENGLLYVKRQVPGEGVRELERYLELAPLGTDPNHITRVRALVTQLRQSMGAPRAARSNATQHGRYSDANA